MKLTAWRPESQFVGSAKFGRARKLCPADRTQMKRLHTLGRTPAQIATLFHVTESYVRHVIGSTNQK
jgi:hypothetical protein